jgi:undecaprenyl-diphosphatase
MIETLETIDGKLFVYLNSRHSEFFDRVMWFVSGIPQWIPLYLLILGWIVYKFRRKSLLIILALALLIALSDQISVHIKLAVDRLRPCQDPDIRDWVHLVNGHCGGLYGFVSSHAANSFAFAVFTSLLFNNRYYTVFILLWASVVSYSRIYLGVHYPGDVLCGAILGVVLAFLVYWLYRVGERKIFRAYTHPVKPGES